MLQWQRAAEARAGTDPDESTVMDCDIAIYQTVYADADSDGPGSNRGRTQRGTTGLQGYRGYESPPGATACSPTKKAVSKWVIEKAYTNGNAHCDAQKANVFRGPRAAGLAALGLAKS